MGLCEDDPSCDKTTMRLCLLSRASTRGRDSHIMGVAPGLLIVITMWPLLLVFGIQLAGLFKHPAFSVGVVGWFMGVP